MKDFFRHPVIGIDRILSSGIKWQLLFLLGVIVAAILLFIVIEWLTGSILTIKENDPRNIFVDVYYHFADPGNQYVVEGTWNRFLAFLISDHRVCTDGRFAHLYFLEYYSTAG